MSKATLLIVDDEKNARVGLQRALEPRYRVLLADQGAQALEWLGREHVDVVLSDLRMPGMDGLTLIRRILAHPSQPICVLLTAYGTIETAVEAMKAGAYDYLKKPVNLDELDLLLQRALRSRTLEKENLELRKQLDGKYGLEQMIGHSSALQNVLDTIRQAAPSRATVLIQGESGTGKELAARAIHRLSPRARGPFVAVHCAALAENLLESELFGHEKGAFTGAVERRPGRFEKADGGTLFLDEVGEIPLSVQVKILRVLEERAFERVGGQQTLEVDVRLVAASNRDLRRMVEEGTFREDLFYRLHVVTLRLPPLRERHEDIPLLVRHFIDVFRRENQRPVEGITGEALDKLCRYEWPGNVRELRNVIERMIVLGHGGKLTVRDLPSEIRDSGEPAARDRRNGSLSLQASERALMEEALRKTGGNRTLAARELGISRRTLHRKLHSYGIHAPSARRKDPRGRREAPENGS